MKKRDIKMGMQEGFSRLSPDVFEAVRKAVECENQTLQEIETEKFSENQNAADVKKGWMLASRRTFSGRFSKYAISACVSMVLLCICLLGIFGKKQKDIYLLLDINPSIQIVMDESFRVKGLQGLNQDGIEVVKKLEWNKKESLFDTLDRMLENVVEGAYLKEDGGILITICLSDHEMYENLENKMGTCIDCKLKEMGISGVITAFQQGEEGNVESGRKQLEERLAKAYGVNAQQMSVMDLLCCSREYVSSGVSFSAGSERQWEEISRQKKEQNEKNAGKKQEKSSTNEVNQKDSDKQEVERESEKMQNNRPEIEKLTDEEKKEESPEKNGDKQNPEAIAQPQENVNPSASTEKESSQNELQPSDNGQDADKDKNGSNKDKDKNSNNKDKNKNGNNKDKEKNSNNKDKDKNGNNKGSADKDKNNNGNNNDKNGNNKDKDKNDNHKDSDKDNNGNNKDKDKDSNNKDKAGDSSKKDGGN